MQDFKKLEVWRLSFELGKKIYKITSTFPKEEIYSITSQLRKSALSISANISEGTGKDSDKDFLRFLRISMGSLKETENFTLMSRDLNYMQKETSEEVLKEIKIIGIKLNNFMKAIKNSIKEETERKKLKKLTKSGAALKNENRIFSTSNQQAARPTSDKVNRQA